MRATLCVLALALAGAPLPAHADTPEIKVEDKQDVYKYEFKDQWCEFKYEYKYETGELKVEEKGDCPAWWDLPAFDPPVPPR